MTTFGFQASFPDPVPFAYADFLVAFPEFANTTFYPQTTVAFWEKQAYLQLPIQRFGPSLDLAAMLFVAHNLVLSARAATAGASGRGVGDVTGPETAKAVGGVSKSMDIDAVTTSGAGVWNSTSYGLRLMQMLRAFGTARYIPGPARNGGFLLSPRYLG